MRYDCTVLPAIAIFYFTMPVMSQQDPSSLPDHYATLGVQPGSTDDVIKKRYRLLALENHPDRAQGSTAAFERIGEGGAEMFPTHRRFLSTRRLST